MLAKHLAGQGFNLALAMLEVGAQPSTTKPEPFYAVTEAFASAQVLGLEPDPVVCAEMNRSRVRRGVHYMPVALGRRRETRPFYITRSPLCCSLYPPEPSYPERYHSIDGMRLESVGEVATISLDELSAELGGAPIDFIKIDIQGAELEVFQGGTATLRNTLCIVTEVAFVPMYVGQPLFADVDAFLRSQGFRLHKLLGTAGRALKPIILNNNKLTSSQLLWGDAMYVREWSDAAPPGDEALLKQAVLLDLYGSIDAAYHALQVHDVRKSTRLAASYLEAFAAASP
jgi:FkbM family methyltransferase